MKKIISIILSIAMIMSVCAVSVYADDADVTTQKTYDIDGSYPYVFVHGMGGWGPENEEMIPKVMLSRCITITVSRLMQLQ